MGNKVGKLCGTIPKFTRKAKKLVPPSATVPPFVIRYNSPKNLFDANAAAPVQETRQSPDLTNQNPTFICQICLDSKPLSDSFNVNGCAHFYCSECTIKYIVSKLQDNVLHIPCPERGCVGVLDSSYCNPILPNEVSLWWEKALCESVFSENVKFYCPYENCSALLIYDGEATTDSVCPHCRREFCVKCKAPWHPELTCAKFQRMRDNNDALMQDLAKRRNWRRCPKCKQFVEKSSGCNYVKCRCQHPFCYNCGNTLNASNSHTCPRCEK